VNSPWERRNTIVTHSVLSVAYGLATPGERR
jgi:hypothetical protein